MEGGAQSSVGGPKGAPPLDLELLGSRLRLHVAEAGFREDLARCFARHAERPAAGEVDLELEVGAPFSGPPGMPQPRPVRVLHGTDATPFRVGAESATELCSRLVRWAVAAERAPYVLHAAAVSRGGRALLLPGESRAGKSTTTAGLLQRGFELLTDEATTVELGGVEVGGLPRALGLRADVLELLAVDPGAGVAEGEDFSCMLRPEALDARWAARPARLALIALPHHEPGAALRLERCSPGRAAAELLACAWSQPRFKVEGLEGMLTLARRAPAYELRFSRLEEALDALVSAFERHAAEEA